MYFKNQLFDVSTAEALRDKELSGLNEREIFCSTRLLILPQSVCVLTINSYNRQRKRKPSSSCQTFLCNSITHQCLLLFQCKTRDVLWRETLPSKPRWWNSRFLFVQRCLNQCGVEAIWASQGPNQGSRALQGAEGGKKEQRSSMQRQADPEETPLDGLFAWRASA